MSYRGGGGRGGRGFSGGAPRGGRGGFRGGGGGRGAPAHTNTKTTFNDSDDEGETTTTTVQQHTMSAPQQRPKFKPKAPVADDEYDEDMDNEDDAAPTAVNKNKTRKENVQTSLTEDGTELPTRLNNRVFVDGLPYQEPTKGPSLKEALYNFCDQWKVGKVVNLIKKPGQGFGYLVFRSPHSVEAAINVLNERKFLGRALRVELPKERGADGNVVGEKRDKPDKLGITTFSRQVLLSDLSQKANPDVLLEVIKELNPGLGERIEKIKMVGRGRKAFVTLEKESDVEEAVALLNGFSLLGRMVCCTAAQAPGTLAYSKIQLNNKVMPGQDGDSSKNNNADPAALGVENATAAAVVGNTNRKTLANSKFDYEDVGPDEIFVGNLPDQASVEQIKSHFSSAGRIVDAELLMNEHTRQSSGIARLRFAIPGQAKYAKQHLDGSQLLGSVLKVDRGEETSAVPGVGQPVGDMNDEDELSEIDEDGFLEHMGVKDKKAYFKGTSVEEKPVGKKIKGKQQQLAAEKKAKTNAAAGTVDFDDEDDEDDGADWAALDGMAEDSDEDAAPPLKKKQKTEGAKKKRVGKKQ